LTYAGELGFAPDLEPDSWIELPTCFGSGKLVTPCERMQRE
jgi:hypothetical protein